MKTLRQTSSRRCGAAENNLRKMLSETSRKESMEHDPEIHRQGSPSAQLVSRMIDAWFANDLERLESVIVQIGDDYGVVFRTLIVVLGGTIDAIAANADKAFEEILPALLTQIDQQTESMDAASVARQALTAWSTGDDDLVTGLALDPEIQRIGPDLVLVHFLGMLAIISRSWAKQAGISMEDIRDGWKMALGVRD